MSNNSGGERDRCSESPCICAEEVRVPVPRPRWRPPPYRPQAAVAGCGAQSPERFHPPPPHKKKKTSLINAFTVIFFKLLLIGDLPLDKKSSYTPKYDLIQKVVFGIVG